MDALWDAHVATTIATKQGEDRMAAVDHAMKKVSNAVNDQIAKQCTGNGLLMTFPNNNLQLMVICKWRALVVAIPAHFEI